MPVDMGWRDFGSWASLWEALDRTGDGNAVHHGPVTALDTTGSLLRSNGPELAVIGVKDHVVVATADAVLFCLLDRAEEVKTIAERRRQADPDENLIGLDTALRDVNRQPSGASASADEYRPARISARAEPREGRTIFADPDGD